MNKNWPMNQIFVIKFVIKSVRTASINNRVSKIRIWKGFQSQKLFSRLYKNLVKELNSLNGGPLKNTFPMKTDQYWYNSDGHYSIFTNEKHCCDQKMVKKHRLKKKQNT